MSDFLRPEARAALLRWREALAGAALLGLGLWIALASHGLLSWLGWAGAGLGAALVYTGVQHGRFRAEGQGPGVVSVTERRVTYYGPLTGGTAELDRVRRLDLVPGRPVHWLLSDEAGTDLAIPVNAAGAEGLLDAFAALPGLRTGALLRALETEPPGPVTVWRRAAPAHGHPALTAPPSDGTP